MGERWSYSLSPNDEAMATRVGYLRQEPMLGQPHRNTNYSEGDLYEAWQHGLSAGSEIALARMLGFDSFVPSVNTFKDELDIPGVCEVRYSQTQRGLRFTDRDHAEAVYVLMAEGINQRTKRLAPDYLSPPYKAIGWMLGIDCLYDKWQFNASTWYVPIAELSPMHTFIGSVGNI